MSRRYGVICLIGMILAGILLSGCSNSTDKAAAAGKYPARPITVIVPADVGGRTDRLAQIIGKLARKYLARDVIILRVPGDAAAAWDEVAGAKPDGNTIGITSQVMLLQSLHGRGKYNYFTSLEPLAGVGAVPVAAVVRSDTDLGDRRSWIAGQRLQEKILRFGYSRENAMFHIVSEVFRRKSGLSAEHRGLSNGAETIAALLAGKLDVGFVDVMEAKEELSLGHLQVLAVTGKQRLITGELGQIPTFHELGMDIPFDSWLGIAVPQGMPPMVKQRLSEAIRAMAKDDEFRYEMERMGLLADYMESGEARSKWILAGEKLTGLVREENFEMQ
ncbi:MAG TPA: tripartite tricarboxylate transporter substrate-binding protein [Patescibacteria group bacterium]|nr:tripartite tricarboxylate transporter substrate-binding protein [Patescibacteria group bacterium]